MTITLYLDKPPWFANLLRRLIMEEAPSMAIEDVYVHQNNVYWNEWFANRLGLIPIYAPIDYIKNDKVVKASLKVKDREGWVYADEIKIEDENVKIAYKKIPLIWVEKWHEIDMEFEIKVGQGKVHSKWIPAHTWYYKEVYGILKKKDNKTKELINSLGLKIDGNKVYGDRTKLEALEKEGILELKETGRIVFNIEGFGMVEEKEILPLAIDVFVNRLDVYIKTLSNE